MVAGGACLTYAQPLLLLFFVIATCGFVARRRWLVGAGLIGLFLVSWPPAAWVGAHTLERWFSPAPPAAPDAEAIVVLSGGIINGKAGQLDPGLKENTYVRCRYAAWLWSHHKGLPVLLSGGGVSPREPTPIALVMRRMMLAQGIPEPLLWTEPQSDSTYENALFSAQILHQKGIRRILLVTEAYHMLRSERCFRKQGLEVIPAPCGFFEIRFSTDDLLPNAGGIRQNELTLHEWLGLGWYWIRRRT